MVTAMPPTRPPDKPALAREKVLPHAEMLRHLLAPLCLEVEIAGSIRRQKEDVSDIEICALPLPLDAPDLFGGEVRGLYAYAPEWADLLRSLQGDGIIVLDEEKPRNGPRHKRFVLPALAGPGFERGLGVDLFLADSPDNWGNTLAIRTGSAPFSQFLVNRAWSRSRRRQHNGYLFQCERGDSREGPVLDGRRMVPCRTEEDYFAAVDVPYIEPRSRNEGAIHRIRKAGR